MGVDESLLGNRFGATDDVEGSGEEGSGEEGSGEVDAVGNGREMVDDHHEAEEMHEDGFENICGLTTEYIMPRAAKNKDGQFRFIVNHPEGGEELVIDTFTFPSCCTCLMRQNMFKRR